jgi:DNA topoisomerase-1
VETKVRHAGEAYASGQLEIPTGMDRLRRVDCSTPGIGRIRHGKGFRYVDKNGEPIHDPEVLERIRDLVIPPAWKDVWICPHPMGHIQATGVDAAGRKQYLYHARWREHRDRQKFDDMVAFARDLPALRERVDAILHQESKLTRERVLACAIRLLDRGFFRIGSEDYAVSNDTYGLATMRKEHVRLEDEGTMVFDYPAKHSKRRVQGVVDPPTADVVAQLKRRRSGGDELLAYRDGREWRDVRSPDINAFIKEATGADHSAKDFRTWNATLLAAVALAVSGAVADTPTGRKRAVARAIKEVSGYLGNTPAVCRASYVDPRVIDAYRGGVIIRPALEEVAANMRPDQLPIHARAVEEAVLDLVTGVGASAPGLEKVA